MAEPKKRAFLSVPSLNEALTLAVAAAALVVSILSYRTSQSTEDALQEDVRVDCKQIPKVNFVAIGTDGSSSKRYQVNTSWILTAYNNSRSPVEIIETTYGMIVPGGLVSDRILGDTDTRGAAHPTGPIEVTLDPAKSTTFGFSQPIPISPQAAQVAGVLASTSIYDADNILADKGFDIFGADNRVSNGASHNRAAGPATQAPQIIVTAITSRGKSFSGTCYVASGDWD